MNEMVYNVYTHGPRTASRQDNAGSPKKRDDDGSKVPAGKGGNVFGLALNFLIYEFAKQVARLGSRDGKRAEKQTEERQENLVHTLSTSN